MVRNAYQDIGTEYETLLRAFDKENAVFAKRVGKDRAKNTYNKYLMVRKYVAEFINMLFTRTKKAAYYIYYIRVNYLFVAFIIDMLKTT